MLSTSTNLTGALTSNFTFIFKFCLFLFDEFLIISKRNQINYFLPHEERPNVLRHVRFNWNYYPVIFAQTEILNTLAE